MRVHVQSVNFNVDKGLKEFIETKVDNLERFYDRIIDAEVYLKVQNTSEKENKIAEIKLNVPGDEFIVKKQCKSFEESVDSAAEALRRHLRKKKENSALITYKIPKNKDEKFCRKNKTLYICKPLEKAVCFFVQKNE